jgi:hypothetical protein
MVKDFQSDFCMWAFTRSARAGPVRRDARERVLEAARLLCRNVKEALPPDKTIRTYLAILLASYLFSRRGFITTHVVNAPGFFLANYVAYFHIWYPSKKYMGLS